MCVKNIYLFSIYLQSTNCYSVGLLSIVYTHLSINLFAIFLYSCHATKYMHFLISLSNVLLHSVFSNPSNEPVPLVPVQIML